MKGQEENNLKYHLQLNIIDDGIKIELINRKNKNQAYEAYLSNIRNEEKLADFFQDIEQLRNYMFEQGNLIIDYDLKVIQIVALMQNRQKSKKITLIEIHLSPVKVNMQTQLTDIIKRCDQQDQLSINEIKDYFRLISQHMIKLQKTNKSQQNVPHQLIEKLIQKQVQKLRQKQDNIEKMIKQQINTKIQSFRLQMQMKTTQSITKLENKFKDIIEQKIGKLGNKLQQNKKQLTFLSKTIKDIQNKVLNEMEQNLSKLSKKYASVDNNFKIISDNLINLGNSIECTLSDKQITQRRQGKIKPLDVLRKIDIKNWIDQSGMYIDRVSFSDNLIQSGCVSSSAFFGKNKIKGKYCLTVYIQKMPRECSIGFIAPENQHHERDSLKNLSHISRLAYKSNGSIHAGQNKHEDNVQKFSQNSEVSAIIDTIQSTVEWKLNRKTIVRLGKQDFSMVGDWIPYVHAIGPFRLALSEIIY